LILEKIPSAQEPGRRTRPSWSLSCCQGSGGNKSRCSLSFASAQTWRAFCPGLWFLSPCAPFIIPFAGALSRGISPNFPTFSSRGLNSRNPTCAL